MIETVSLLDILTNAAPLVLSTIILAASLIAFLYAMMKIVIPAMQEMNTTFHVQRESWSALIDEQNRINTQLTEELQNDLSAERAERIKLEVRVDELERELATKTRQLETANRRITEMQVELNKVKADREKVTRERDNLRLEVDELHREVAQLRNRLNELPATGDGGSKEREGDGKKKA